jgi:catechol 2,3-dioxygenase-like lactoylglutathione lyase family enzyme
MRNKAKTLQFYTDRLGFRSVGVEDYDEYLMLQRDGIEIHFFSHKDLDPSLNDGQVYIRTDDVDGLYRSFLTDQVPIHPAGPLQTKPWGQREFAVLDPDHNLLTFGQAL